MIFDFEESEINFIYGNLRKFPLVFDEVSPILSKIEQQFNKNKTEAANKVVAENPPADDTSK